jgi:hypothetical protein
VGRKHVREAVNQAVSFGERLAASQIFVDLFRDGMALVEETAAYLDGPGRQDSKKLERSAALAYATESMRAADAARVLAPAAPRGKGGRNVAGAGEQGEAESQAVSR